MSPTNEDLDIFTENFRKVIQLQKRNKRVRNNLCKTIGNINNELEICKNNEADLENSLRKVLDNSKDISITHKCVTLKEKCFELESENKSLKNQVEELNAQIKNEVENQKNMLTCQINEIEEKYEAEIMNLRNKIESDKIRYDDKENELNSALQLAEAATAIQCDEIESNLKRQLVDITSKLRQSQNSVRNLQLEINNLKNQLATQQRLNNSFRNNTLYFKETPVKTIKNNLANNASINRENNIGYCIENHEQKPYNQNQPERPRSTISGCSSMKNFGKQYWNEHGDCPNIYDQMPTNISTERSYIVDEPQNNSNNSFQKPMVMNQYNTATEETLLNQNCYMYDAEVIKQTKQKSQRNQMLKDPKSLKYPVLPLASDNTTTDCEETDSELINSNSILQRSMALPKKHTVPLTIPCSESKKNSESNVNTKKKTVRRKRKLYNPDDTDFYSLQGN